MVAHGKCVGVDSGVDIRWGYSQLRHRVQHTIFFFEFSASGIWWGWSMEKRGTGPWFSSFCIISRWSRVSGLPEGEPENAACCIWHSKISTGKQILKKKILWLWHKILLQPLSKKTLRVEGLSKCKACFGSRCTWGDLERSLKLIGRFSFSRFYSDAVYLS